VIKMAAQTKPSWDVN